MLEGMYAAAAGMYAQQARLDSLSNDVANVNTAGYKPVRQAFRDLMYGQAGIAATNANMQLGTGAEVANLGRGTAQGAFQQTDNPLDIAVSGPGYFTVKNPADGKTVLTRAGNLQIDVQGRISTATGELLEPEVKVPAGTDGSKVAIVANGSVQVNGKEIGKINLVNVAAPTRLDPLGDTNFGVNAESGPARAAGADTTVQQGVLEMSSANLGDTMTAMIETQRAYELTSKAITTQDKIAEIAIGVKR
ncbi:MAG: flagellar hook-basal body protein [Solirubrobacteraceae bacterium]|nr:flagellar hook-basal body protein [Solirubrobacteraceae bacterium]